MEMIIPRCRHDGLSSRGVPEAGIRDEIGSFIGRGGGCRFVDELVRKPRPEPESVGGCERAGGRPKALVQEEQGVEQAVAAVDLLG